MKALLVFAALSLFAAGLALSISLERKRQDGTDRLALLRGLLRRAAIIFLIGLLLNLIPAFQLASLRVPGVLQRIALTVVIAAPIVIWGRWRAALAAILGLVALYLVLMLLVPVSGSDGLVAAGRLEPGHDFGAWLDRLTLGGHLWSSSRTWDPEGIVSTLPATASLLFGVLAGAYLATPTGRLPKSLALLLGGLLCLGLGLGLGAVLIPVNKNLWTPSYAVFTTGWSLVILAACHALLEEAPPRLRTLARQACLPLTIYGRNALFLFVCSGLIARLLQGIQVASGGVPMPLKAWLFQGLSALPLSPENASLLFALVFNLVMFTIAWALWRKQWFVKV